MIERPYTTHILSAQFDKFGHMYTPIKPTLQSRHDHIHHPWKSSHAPLWSIFLPSPSPKQLPIYFLSQWTHLYFLESHINGILCKWNHIAHTISSDHRVHVFLVWLPLLNIIILRFIFVVARINSSFLLLAELYSIVWMLLKMFSKQRVSEFAGIKYKSAPITHKLYGRLDLSKFWNKHFSQVATNKQSCLCSVHANDF